MLLPPYSLRGEGGVWQLFKMVQIPLKNTGTNNNRDIVNPDNWGPMNEYDQRVKAGRLRDDEHQRGQPEILYHQFLD